MERPRILSDILKDLKILILEDEFLIAMDVEQICRDNGASVVKVVRSLNELEPNAIHEFDAAIVDVMLGGVTTLDFAASLRDANRPFLFASGYTDNAELATKFPGVALVTKPYSETELVNALARACDRSVASGSA
jgi:CheY-like chemotaxis protein